MHRVALRRGSNPRRPRGGTGLAPTYPFTITSLTPSSVAQGSPNTQIAAGGVDFQSGSTVYVDGVAATTAFVTAVLINFTLTAAVALVPGYKVIQIKRTTFASNLRLLAVLFPLPTLATATITGAGNTLNVTGTGWFASGTHARIDDTIDAPFTFLTGTTGTVSIPQSVLDVPGTHTIRIFNDAPGGGLSASRNFEAKFKNSSLVSLSLTEQFAGRSAGPILLEGDLSSESVFYPESILKVDSTPVAFVLIDANHLSFTIPGALLLTPGPHSVTVTNPTTGGGGGVSNALVFTSFAPTLLSLSITEVVQYFDGFDVSGTVDFIDANFQATYNGVGQPTTLIDGSNFVVHVTSAANSVPGTTTVRLRDTISGVSTMNSIAITVYPWDPSRIGAAVRIWLDGTTFVDDGAGRASAWNDRSGGNRHTTQAAAGQRPLIVASVAALNGKPALRFDNIRKDLLTYLQWLTVGAAGVINRTSYNIWVVAIANLANAGVLGDGPGYIHVAGTITTPERLSVLDDRGGSVVNYSPFAWSAGAPFAFRARLNATTFYSRVNRNAEVSAALWGPNANLFAPTTFVVGAKAAGGGGAWKGDIAFVLVTNAELNTTYKALLDNMLSYEFNLPFGSAGSAPTITSVAPNVATQFALPFWMIVEDLGGSFTALSTVNVFDTALTTEFLSPTQLRARIPNAALATAGGRAITVSDVGGISAPTGLTVLPYVDQPGPNVYSSTPNTAYQHGAAFTANLLGVGFTPTCVVYADGIACATTPGDATHISAVIPVQALDVLPGPLITVRDGALTSNPFEITLTPWSPASILGGTAWLRGDSLLLGTGTEVAQLTDKLGFARNFTQATSTKRPNLIASDPNFNGKPSIDFDGVDDYMTGPGISSLYGATHATTLVVFRADAITGTGTIAAPYNNNCVVGVGGGNIGFALKNTPQAYGYTNDGAYQVATNTALAATTTTQAMLIAGANSINIHLNGVAGTPDTFATMTIGAQIASLGSNLAFTANFLNGQIAEVFYSSLPLTAQDLICWPNYCRYNYGTP